MARREASIRLGMTDWLQILDALEVRKERWELTARWLEGEEDLEEEYVGMPEEADSPEEAKQIAQHYADIIAKIRRQLR
jgi:hypothetical protein